MGLQLVTEYHHVAEVYSERRDASPDVMVAPRLLVVRGLLGLLGGLLGLVLARGVVALGVVVGVAVVVVVVVVDVVVVVVVVVVSSS